MPGVFSGAVMGNWEQGGLWGHSPWGRWRDWKTPGGTSGANSVPSSQVLCSEG